MEQDPFTVEPSSGIELSPADRQMVQALATVLSARKGVTVLRVVAAIVALTAVVGQGLNILDSADSFEDLTISDRQLWASFLAGISVPLAFAGLILAASYLLEVYASRLDMDIVIAEQDEPDDD